jgi:Lar family restriction alleviation protein
MTLKACPFCHTVDRIMQESDCYGRFIECLLCGARGPIARSEDEAAELWNRRTGDVPG